MTLAPIFKQFLEFENILSGSKGRNLLLFYNNNSEMRLFYDSCA